MDDEGYALLIGKIHVNLLSLEALLRLALYNKETNPDGALPYGLDIWKTKVGETVPANALTDYRSLGDLIDDYNKALFPENPESHINREVVKLRDAFAHGRVAAENPDGNNFLVKFSKPTGGQVTVTDSQELSEAWLKDQVRLLKDQLIKAWKVV